MGDLLVAAGIISREELERAFERAKVVGERRILSELFAMGLAHERALAETLAQQLGAPVAVLSECVVDLELVRLVSPELLKKHKALPIASDESSVTFVSSDLDGPALAMPLAFATGRRPVQIIGIKSILDSSVNAALKAAAEGKAQLVGKRATARHPFVAVARYAPAVSVAEANALAKQIIDVLTDAPQAGMHASTPVGAMRLKQMVIGGGVAVVEKAREVRDPASRTAALLDRVPEAPAEDAEPMVLVVDDDDGIRAMLTKALEHDGYTVVTAQNGDEAVTLLRLMRPHVIVLDAMLPMIHGFEICAALKRSPLRDVPVIMISAVYRGWELAREIQEVHGADAFVEKPFELTYVRKLVAELLRRPHAKVPKPADVASRVEEARSSYEDHAGHGLFLAAEADVQLWIALDPFDGRAWLERANLCAMRGDLVGAMSAYEAAVVYDSKLLVAHLGLAVVYEKLGFQRRARATWLKARELAPDDVTRASIDRHISAA